MVISRSAGGRRPFCDATGRCGYRGLLCFAGLGPALQHLPPCNFIPAAPPTPAGGTLGRQGRIRPSPAQLRIVSTSPLPLPLTLLTVIAHFSSQLYESSERGPHPRAAAAAAAAASPNFAPSLPRHTVGPPFWRRGAGLHGGRHPGGVALNSSNVSAFSSGTLRSDCYPATSFT